MRPWEVLRYTPGQLRAAIKEKGQALARADDLQAVMTAHMMNATGNFKTPISAEMLLGRKLTDGE